MIYRVRENSSMLIIIDCSRKNILTTRYDQTLPKVAYRGRINLIGGAEDKGDSTPKDTILREIDEEIVDVNLKRAMLKKLKFYRDFLSIIPAFDGGPKSDYISLDSVFYTEIKDELMSEIAMKIKKGERLITEGLLTVVPIKDLGKELCAWSTAQILEYYFGCPMINHERAISVPLGTKTVGSHKKYRKSFEYIN